MWRRMFAEESLLEENPDDISCDIDVSTPKRKKGPRKRTRSGKSLCGADQEGRYDDSASATATATVQPRTTSKTKMLNKKERAKLISNIKKCSVLKEVKTYFENHQSSVFEELVAHHEGVLKSLINFNLQTFISLYEGNGTGKDKYISFQLEWHKHCSIFLLSKDLTIQYVISPPTYSMETARQEWLKFCDGLPSEHDEHKRFMILLSSTIYDILLREADKHLSSTTITSDSESTASCMHNRDTDDVYFRFGGATLASMLKHRYKDI